MFVYRVLDHIFSGLPEDDDEWSLLGALVNAVKAQCYNDNHTYSSAHTLEDVVEFRVHVYHAQSLHPGGTYIPLPKRIVVTGAVINPINRNDDQCFEYTIYLGLLHTYGKKKPHMEWPATILDMKRDNYIDAAFPDDMPMPATRAAFKRFEEANGALRLNVYTTTDNLAKSPITSLYVGKNESDVQINLLYIKNGENTHYVYIKNMPALMFQVTRSHAKKVVCEYCGDVYFHSDVALQNHLFDKHPQLFHQFVCPRCLNIFQSQEQLEFHKFMCIPTENTPRPVRFLPMNKDLKWEERDNYKCIDLPIRMYADFESILTKVDIPAGARTRRIEQHDPCAFCIYVKSAYEGKYWCNKAFTGVYWDPTDCMENFCNCLLNLSKSIWHFMGTCCPMLPLTKEQEVEFGMACFCYLCKHKFRGGPGHRKVMDHDHITGKYLGAACNACNLKRQHKRWFLPLFFHNAKGYDLHHILREITKPKYLCKFEGIPQSSEKRS